MKPRYTGILFASLAIASFGACTDDSAQGSTPSGDGSKQVLTAGLTVTNTVDLPACTVGIAGTTAFVSATSALWTCQDRWTETYCTASNGGAVAYLTESDSLLACSGKAWRNVTVPGGGAGGTSLIATVTEAPGANCASGGLKVNSGLDDDGDSVLDPGEVTAFSYVCNGDDGDDGANGGTPTLLRTVQRTATLGECSDGGSAITFYQDLNGNSTLDGGEQQGPAVVVCNGDPVSAFGASPVAKNFRGAAATGVFVAAQGEAGSEEVISVTLTTPRAGTIFVIGSSVSYCESPAVGGGYDCAPNPDQTFAWLTIVDSPVSTGQAGNSGEAISALLTPNKDTQLNVTAIYDNIAAGTHTFYLVGMSSSFTPANLAQVYYGASEITAIFVPNN